MREKLAQLGDSTAELIKMSSESELTIREHCDSIRLEVDIARETALEDIHKASNTLLTEIDAYEHECLSSLTTAKETTEVNDVKDVSKRMRAFLAQQQAFLQTVQEREDELIPHLDEANKLAQELSDRKKELKAAMFNGKLASFIKFPRMDVDVSLGELAFTDIHSRHWTSPTSPQAD